MKRFWKDVTVGPAGEGWQVALDGRGIRTAGGAAQIVPTRALADALAAEWAGQGEEVDPARFVFRDMADYAIDVIAASPATAIDAIVPYGDTDTLLYRDVEGSALHRRQLAAWEPLLTAAEARHDVRFLRASGVIHQPQSPETLARLRAAVSARDPFQLAALQTVTSLAASLVIGLAALVPQADAEALWHAASLEEDWQAELWGRDAEAQARAARRFAGFEAAMAFARLAAR